MSDSEQYDSAKDEEHKEAESEEVVSSDDAPLKKSSPKKKKVEKGKTKPKGRTIATKQKKRPAKKQPATKSKQTKVSLELAPSVTEEEDPLKSDDDDEEEEYEVESIVGHREYNGKLVYKIRWKNYASIHDTWEEHQSLSCPDLLEVYNIKHKVKIPTEGIKAKRGRPKGTPKKAKKPRRSSVSDDEIVESDESNICDDHDSNDGEGEDGAEYEVDKIVEMRFKRDGKREFLVHWKKWSSKYDTWEPEENLSCPELIEKFMEKAEEAKNSNQKDLRVNRKNTDRFTSDTGRRSTRRGNNKQRVNYGNSDEDSDDED